jgi:hypothetical protein
MFACFAVLTKHHKMNKIPSFDSALKTYNKAKAEGKSINDLHPLEQLVILFTPGCLFKAWSFRHRLMVVFAEAELKPGDKDKAQAFIQRYSSPQDRFKLTKLIQRVTVEDSE